MRYTERRRRPISSVLLALLLLCAGPAMALEFGSESQIYSEIIDTETAYPTTPEIDLIGAGGMVPVFYGTNPPVLTGTVARVTLTFPGESGGQQIDASGIGTGSFGVSGAFGDLVIPPDTALAPSVSARFVNGIVVTASLVIPHESSGLESYIYLLFFDIVDPSTADEVIFVLPDIVPDSLRAGTTAPAIRLFVDPGSSTARASVEFVGLGIFEAAPLSLPSLGSGGVDLLAHGAQLGQGTASTFGRADLKAFAVYSEPAAFEPLFNVDFGTDTGTPAPTYAAAGSAGAWNSIVLGTKQLATVTGVASPATVTLTTDEVTGLGPVGPPDAAALMGDFGVDCNTDVWSVSFSGLPNGWYRVFLYAPQAPGASTGVMDVPQGEILADLPGDVGPALLPGVSYVRTTAMILNGNLDVTGQGDGTFACAAIAGVQLERQLLPAPPPVALPALSLPAAGALIASLVAAALCAVGGPRRVANGPRRPDPRAATLAPRTRGAPHARPHLQDRRAHRIVDRRQ